MPFANIYHGQFRVHIFHIYFYITDISVQANSNVAQDTISHIVKRDVEDEVELFRKKMNVDSSEDDEERRSIENLSNDEERRAAEDLAVDEERRAADDSSNDEERREAEDFSNEEERREAEVSFELFFYTLVTSIDI